MQEKNIDSYSLPLRLKTLKAKKQWKWSQVASAVGLSDQMVYAILGGKVGMSTNSLYRLEQAEKEAGIEMPSRFPDPNKTLSQLNEGELNRVSELFDPSEANTYSHLQTETLQKNLSDLANKLPTLPERERENVIANIHAITDELKQREMLKKSVAEVKEPKVVYGRKKK